MAFKDRLKLLREKENLSVTALASRFGKSEGAVRMWETGKSFPDVTTLMAIARSFHVSVDFLLETEEDNPSMPDYPPMLRDLIAMLERKAYPVYERLQRIEPPFPGNSQIYNEIMAYGFNALLIKLNHVINHPEQFYDTDVFTEEQHKDTIDVTLLEIFLGFRLEE